MKNLAYPLAILAIACAAFNAQADATEYKDVKKFVTKNAREVKQAFSLAAKQRGRQAIEISCSPADSQWCADDFVQACEDHGGGASSNPEGGVTCSLPQWD